MGVQSPGQQLAHLPAASALPRIGQRRGVGEAFGGRTRWASWQGGVPALGETSTVLRPRGTEPAGEQREPGPQAEILSLSLGGGLHPWSAKALLDLPGSPARPSSQPWGSALTLRLQWGSSYWLKILYVLPKRVLPSSRLSPPALCFSPGEALSPLF